MSVLDERERAGERTAAVPDPGSVRQLLVHASVLDGVVGATKALTVTLLVGVRVTAAVPVVGLVAFAIYASNKLVDDEDAVNAPERAAFVAAHRETLLAGTVLAYALALGLALTAGPAAFGLAVLPGVAAVAYSVALPGTGDRRLKDVLGANNVLVSVAWAVPVIALPLVWTDTPVTAAAAVAFAFYLLQTAVAFEVRNVRDVAGDRAEGVRTVPVVWGVPATRRLLAVVDASALGLYAAASATGVLAPAVGLGFGVATVGSMAITALVDRGRDDARLCLLRDANYAVVLGVVAVA